MIGKINSSLDTNGYSTEKKEVSKLRVAFPQVCAVSAKNLLLLTFGTTLGFSTILLPALQKENPDVAVTREEITWISSINLFMVPLGCIISGPISHYLGRKRTMLIANIPFITAWIILYFATSAPYIFMALALTGLTGGLCEAPVLTYVAEVTQPHLRGMLSATASMAVIVGVFTQLLTGSLTDWRTVALINLTYPVMCFVALCMMPESPYWLAGKDRLEDAEKSLCWLRGWVKPSQVREEFATVCQVVKRPLDNEEKQSCWRIFGKKTFISPFILVSLSFFVATFGGTATLQTFAVYIFARMEAPLNKYTATVFLGIAEIIGTAVCVFAIHFTGKRKITFASISGTGVCFLGSAVYGYLIQFEFIDGVNYTWIPTALLIGAAFFSHMGIKLLPWILCGEVFPSKGRSTATGAAATTAYIFSSVANKIFLYMVDLMSLLGTFLFYASVNIAGYIALYYLLPETEGRTLKEIEDHYAGIQSLNSKPNKDKSVSKEKWAASNPGLVVDDYESKL
ncbi:facilitated trehalose transporter Tret1 isoform X3 [Chelonus insularis]|uniref:facilitated trehalose transporter Tret1 isoform X2 n=1 Tax=Chelonus insularis TaxID=460826 RepID=UPI00158A110E|nr:facilitated trehalose transporter Tret1-like isoform X2 [Chelonus insularis]XP_034937940.1 facilitated trehalose transporter Tret1-like isoform X3 [Chelonus insularis]